MKTVLQTENGFYLSPTLDLTTDEDKAMNFKSKNEAKTMLRGINKVLIPRYEALKDQFKVITMVK